MYYYEDIKFRFDVDLKNESNIQKLFQNIGNLLNVQFDENLSPYHVENHKYYTFKEVLAPNISSEVSKFFDFTFDNVINTQLYKFLILKTRDKLIILAIINSLIFDYSSIGNLYDLFKSNNVNLESKIMDYYEDANNYLSSPDFKNDSNYWQNLLLDSERYVKFYNIKSRNYKSKKIKLDNNSINDFLNKYSMSIFDFLTAVFSLYLSRIDGTKSCFLKTTISENTGFIGPFDKKIFLKIKYNPNQPFSDYLEYIIKVLKDGKSHVQIDLEDYVNKYASYYSIFDFSSLDDVCIFKPEGALTLNIYRNSLELWFNSDLFLDEYIDSMLANIESLITNLINSPSQNCENVDILSDDEKDLISKFSKGGHISCDENKTLALAFRENALKNPKVIAIDDGVEQISYGELEKSTNNIANILIDKYGIGLGDIVGLMLPRNYHFPECLLSLNKIGAAFTPIDPQYPLKRIERMLEISEAKYIITTRKYSNLLEFDVELIFIEDFAEGSDDVVECNGNGNDLFSIIFTSGTTGLPKGVMFSNKQVAGQASILKSLFHSHPGDICGCYVSFSFVASIRMYCALYNGETCRIFNENEQKDTLLFIKALNQQPFNDLILPSSLSVLFSEEAIDINVKYLMFGGSKLSKMPHANNYTKFFNGYGTSETLITIATLLDNNSNDMPIGKPLNNYNVHILDENKMPVPIGVAGDLYISGDYISPGYINNFELTDESFSNSSKYSFETYSRIYYTGDICFYDFNGNINIIGRSDDQLSVRGFRVESDEILNIINRFDSIADVFLDVEKDNIVLYYTVEGDFKSDTLKKSLEDELPHYMLPSIYIELDEIPLNINGKIDKSALKEYIPKDYVEKYEDEVLNHVIRSFKKVLSTDFILFDDDFVSLGGNSLSAMELQRVLNDEMDVNIASNKLMELSTPSNIANHIKFDLDIYSSSQIKYDFSGLCPLSESQLNVYLDEQIKDMGTAYNNPFKIKFKDPYSSDKIYDSILKLFDIFPILKSRVFIENEIPTLKFDAEPEIIKESKSSVKSFVRKFELDKCLSRFLIVENCNDSSFLCMDFHHLIFDGTSLNIILKRFLEILDASDGFDIDDGILRQISFEKSIPSSSIREAEKFFDRLLADNDEAHELLASVKTDDLVENEYLDELIIDNKYLNSFLAENKITLNHFLTSAFAYALSRFTGSSKVLFNLVENGRNYIYLSDSVGMFVRTLPLLLDCKNQSIKSFLNYSRDLIISAMKYDFYPYRDLVNKYNLNSSVFFQYSHDIFLNSKKNLFTEELAHDLIGDLSFNVFNSDGGNLGIRVLYSDKFSKKTIESFISSFKSICQELLNKKQLSEIDYISNDDLDVLDKINLTEHDLNYNDILDAFNDNLSKNPNNKLVSYKNNSYTYSEGAFIADKIAESLKNLDVELGDNVSFLVERSELYLLSVLGILSAGAVYVPLDDAHPDERIDFILKDTQSKVIITSDETYERVMDLSYNGIILNLSDIIGSEIGELSHLSVDYYTLACILYTSGTTGVPKGVRITRKSIVNVVSSYVDSYGLSSSDVYGLIASIGFDAASFAINAIMYAGASLAVVPQDIRLNMVELNRYFVENNVTHSFITTQAGKLFVLSIEDTSLEVLLVGGEKLGEFESHGDYTFVDIYGPTEAFTYISLINNCDKIDYSSVGSWNRNTKCYIVDDDFRRVPVGAVGELCLAGYQIADGYLNREEETKDVFIANPFDDDARYGVLYRTGDMARILPNGSLSIVGRRDNQVKIRGNRVELSEVEAVIRELDYVEDVTVQTIKHDDNYELVAYVVSGEFDGDTLRNKVCEYVGEFKPDYMVPSYVINLDTIPLNINGKVDKRALPEIEFTRLQTEYVAPITNTEKIIVQIFESVFDKENIGLYDDFVKLGGNSIIAMQMLHMLSQYNIDINARVILNNRNPYNIAKSIDGNCIDYGFKLVKKGIVNQNLFLIPPIGGISFVYANLIETMEFPGNVYVIDDFRYDLSLEEIKRNKDSRLTLDYYYNSMKNLFQDEDILFGYSLGCIYTTLLADKLEKDNKKIGNCILVDGFLAYVIDSTPSEEELTNFIIDAAKGHDINELKENYSEEFIEKFIEIGAINFKMNFTTPKVNSKITFLATFEALKEDVDKHFPNYEFILIDSTHKDIINKDCKKIIGYIK